MNLSCLIIDDEPLARKLLMEYCNKVPFLNLKADFSNGLEALTYLKSHQVDLIFLDIKMPDISGLELSRSIQNKPKIIFTTAFAEHAVDAFELDAIDYLLKPFDFSRFLKAVNKALPSVSQSDKSSSTGVENEFMLIKDGRELVKVHYKEIRYIKGQKDYVMFVTNKKKVMSLMNLRDLERELPDNVFIRIHQSYIINVEHIESISNDKVLLASEYLPVSQSYKMSFRAFIKTYEAN